MMVHLLQSAFRVFAIRRHDADVVDALAAARANVEAETRHQSSLQIARIAFFRALSAALRCPGVRGCHHTLASCDANIVPRTTVSDTFNRLTAQLTAFVSRWRRSRLLDCSEPK
jgi:hypothetical protein